MLTLFVRFVLCFVLFFFLSVFGVDIRHSSRGCYWVGLGRRQSFVACACRKCRVFKSLRHVVQVRPVGRNKIFALPPCHPPNTHPSGYSSNNKCATYGAKCNHENPIITFFCKHSNERSREPFPPYNQLILAICAVECNLNYVRQTGGHRCGLFAKNNSNLSNGKSGQNQEWRMHWNAFDSRVPSTIISCTVIVNLHFLRIVISFSLPSPCRIAFSYGK